MRSTRLSASSKDAATPTSLKVQKPARWARRAWWLPPAALQAIRKQVKASPRERFRRRKLRAPRNPLTDREADLALDRRRYRAGEHLLDIGRRVSKFEPAGLGRGGLVKIAVECQSGCGQAFHQQPVLAHGKSMGRGEFGVRSPDDGRSAAASLQFETARTIWEAASAGRVLTSAWQLCELLAVAAETIRAWEAALLSLTTLQFCCQS